MNEKTKQAIEKLRVQVRDIKTLKSIVNLIEIDVDEALALLRDEPCDTCGGTKKKIKKEWENGPALQWRGWKITEISCPYCQDKPEQKPKLPEFELKADEDISTTSVSICEVEQKPQSEFTKKIRDYIADFIYAEQHGVAMQHKPRCLERDLIEACDRIDEAKAEKEQIKDEYKRYLNISVEKWRLDAALAENKRLKKAIEEFGNNPAGFDWGVLEKQEQLEARLKETKDKLDDAEAEIQVRNDLKGE